MNRALLKIKALIRKAYFGLYFAFVLLVFEIKLRASLKSGKTAFYKELDNFHNCLIESFLKTFSVTFEKNFESEIKNNTSYVFVCNHQSNLDICILYYFLKPAQTVFIAKEELAKFIPSVSFVIKNDGSAIIYRDKPKQAITEIKKLGKRLESSTETKSTLSAVIFPEGTRSKDGKLGEYQKAGLKTLLKYAPNSIILPVYLSGPGNIASNIEKLDYAWTKITIQVGKELNREDFKNSGEIVKKIETWAKNQEAQTFS